MYKRRIPLHGKNRFYRFLFLKGDIVYYKKKIGIRFLLTFRPFRRMHPHLPRSESRARVLDTSTRAMDVSLRISDPQSNGASRRGW